MNAAGIRRFASLGDHLTSGLKSRCGSAIGGLKRTWLYGTALVVFSATMALAAENAPAKPSEFILILQIVILIAVGRGFGELMQRIGQPSVIGELLAGLLLGPSLFGWIWPDAQKMIFPDSPEQKALIEGLAQFGILLLLLLTGMETDLKLVRRVGRAAATISITGILVPFACGFTLGQFLPREHCCPTRISASSHRCSWVRHSRFRRSRSSLLSCVK